MTDEKKVCCHNCEKYKECGMIQWKVEGAIPLQVDVSEEVGVGCEEFKLKEDPAVEQKNEEELDEASLKKKLVPWQVSRIERLMKLIDNFEKLLLEYKEEDLANLSKRPDTLIRALMLFNQQIRDGVDTLMSLSGAKKEKEGLDPEVLVQVLLSMNPNDREAIQKVFLSMLPKLKVLPEKEGEQREAIEDKE